MNNEFTKWFLTCVTQKYADFNGRSRRKEFWMFFLVVVIINIVLGIVDNMLGLTFNGMGVLGTLAGLALLLPNISAAVRRLHDVGKSGWWLLISLIPFIGLYLIYLFIQDSQPGSNAYGANPKGL